MKTDYELMRKLEDKRVSELTAHEAIYVGRVGIEMLKMGKAINQILMRFSIPAFFAAKKNG
jgi:hypothetical protein